MTRPPVEVFPELDSTNAEARRRAEAGQLGPVWIVALDQTAGRGRRGRAWSTGSGNLAATLLTVVDMPAAEAAQVSFVAALAVHDLAELCLGPGAASLKWPNDLYLSGRKAAGILVESGAREAGGLWLAVGVGINLRLAPEGVERPAIAFADLMTREPPQPEEAVVHLADAFEKWRKLWMNQGFAPLAEAWSERAYGLGRPCEARLPAETVAGTAEGLDPDGALRLRLDDGSLRRITAGDVFFGGA